MPLNFGWLSCRKLVGTIQLLAEIDPVSETSCSYEYQTMDKVQEFSNQECNLPLSGYFKIKMKCIRATVMTLKFLMVHISKVLCAQCYYNKLSRNDFSEIGKIYALKYAKKWFYF